MEAGRGFVIRVLGPVDVVAAGEVHRIGSRNERAVLAALVLAGGRSVPVTTLREVVWPERAPSGADASIHTYVSRLRHLLGHTAIERTDHSYRCDVARHQVDATRFEDLVDAATRVGDDPECRARLCREALGLWRGSPFGDLGDDEAFRLEAFRLDELRLAATEFALGAEIELGHLEIATAELETAIQEHPYREHLWFLLVHALDLGGRRVEALRACARLRQVLAEVGLEPAPDLAGLEARIVGGAPIGPPRGEPGTIRPTGPDRPGSGAAGSG